MERGWTGGDRFVESLDVEQIRVQGDPEPEGDSPSSALAVTFSLEGEGMD